MRPIKKGSTDQSVIIRIIDSIDGTPETGVEYDTTGIDLWYRRELEAKTSITEATLAAVDSAYSAGGIIHIGDGYYRLDLPDAAVAVGAGENGVMVGGTVTDMIVIGCYIPLVDYDPYDTIRMGMTALPAAAADAAGGLPISDAGGLDMDIALKKCLFSDGLIYIDESGTNSTAWPYGSASYPTNTIANGKTISDANAIDSFVCHGDLTTTANMENYVFEGHGHMEVAHRINIDSHSVEHTSFKNIVLQGTMANATGVLNVSRFDNCTLWALSDIHGISDKGTLDGACSLLDGGIFTAKNICCGTLAACTFTLQAPAACCMTIYGTLTIVGMDGGAAKIAMQSGSTLTLDNTNTAGTLTIAGDSSGLTDNSNGTTVVITKPDANTIQVGGTTQTANDNGADINSILTAVITNAAGTDIAADIIALKSVADAIPTTAMRGTDNANTVIPATKAEMDSAHALLATPAQVNTEVVDVLKTDVVAEMAQGAPPETPTMEEILNYLYRKFVQKTETTKAEDAVFDFAGTTKLFKAVLNDADSKLTKSRYETGL